MADPVETPPLTLEDLTSGKIGGTGAFDVLMETAGLHAQREFDKNRIKGQDYAQVYLTAMQYVLQNSVVFLLQKDEAANKANLVNAQIELTKTQIKLAEKQLEQEELRKELIAAQTAQIKADTLNAPKQGLLLDAQAAAANAQVAMTKAQTLNVSKEGLILDNQLLISAKQIEKTTAEITALDKQNLLVAEQTKKVTAETANTITENDSLIAQQCLLKAQYDLTMVQKLQTTAQTSLVQQKIATEKAQVTDTGVDDNSVIGRQKLLYKAQTDGFQRDAEQKAAKMLIDTWNVRRTTDEGTVADATNMLNDATIGRAVNKVLTGVNA